MGFIDIPSLGVQETIPLGKKHTHDIVVRTKDEEPNIAQSYTCTIGRMVEENVIHLDILDPLIEELEDKLA